MSDVIDLTEHRNAKEKPSPEFARRDDFGREMFCYLLNYEMDGAQWGTEVWAYSASDAEARVLAMRSSLKLMGQLSDSVPS